MQNPPTLRTIAWALVERLSQQGRMQIDTVSIRIDHEFGMMELIVNDTITLNIKECD
jgi:hypothetical protein